MDEDHKKNKVCGRTSDDRLEGQWQTVECEDAPVMAKYVAVVTTESQRLIIEEVHINIEDYCC